MVSGRRKRVHWERMGLAAALRNDYSMQLINGDVFTQFQPMFHFYTLWISVEIGLNMKANVISFNSLRNEY